MDFTNFLTEIAKSQIDGEIIDFTSELICGNFLFVIAHEKIKTSKALKRYHLIVTSTTANSVIYHRSNVIDLDKCYKMESFKEIFKNYIKMLNELDF